MRKRLNKTEEKQEEVIDQLHLKYRPQVLDEIIGQDHVVNSLKGLMDDNKLPHVFLFTGNSGVGKTTFARVIANYLKCGKNNIIEIDAATFSGVDDMRQLTNGLVYKSFGSNPIKFVIIDEFHACSKKAIDSFLKIIEEPPEHVYFAFCTTESHKVPRTIETRCHSYHLKDVSTDDILDLLDIVNEEENINLDEKCLYLVADKAQGSVRQALVYLSKVRGCKTKDEVKEVLEVIEGSNEIIELCRLLNDRGKFEKAMKIIKGLNSNNPESIRICIVKYFTTCIMSAKGNGNQLMYLSILDSFSKPIYDAQNGITDIILSVGEVLLQGE